MKQSTNRIIIIDQLRGLAFIMMAIFHFCYDLNYFALAQIPIFSHPFWILFRALIVFLFLSMVGVSLKLNFERGFKPKRFIRRLAKVGFAASLITIGTIIALPSQFIYFGILHMIAVSMILGALLLHLPKQSHRFFALAGIIVFLCGYFYPFDLPIYGVWFWVAKNAPATVDYVPLIPWFGFVLIGISMGNFIEKWINFNFGENYLGIAMQWCGKNALLLYLIHQPILWAGFIIYLILI